MNLPVYALASNEDFHFYKFVSTGTKGDIPKGVQFSLAQAPPPFPIYNLALGDIDPVTGKLNDTSRSGNNDAQVIFATVGASVVDFCNRNKGVAVIAEGNTPAKQWLYRSEIAKNLAAVRQLFNVWGFIGGNWEVFAINRKYTSLLVKPI